MEVNILQRAWGNLRQEKNILQTAWRNLSQGCKYFAKSLGELKPGK